MAGTAQQDPTQAAFSDAAQVPDVPKSGLEKGFGLVGALTTGKPKGGALDEAIEKHHQARLDEAKMHRRNAATAAGILTYGIDPKTGQPLTDEQKQQYQNEYQAAMGHYEKIAGVNKETKGAIQKARMLVEHMIGQGQKKQAGAQGTPPPPLVPGQPAAPSPASSAAPAGPAGGPPPPVPFADAAPFLRGQLSEQREFQTWKRQQDVLRDNKIAEDEALAKARAQAKAQSPGAAPRPVFSRPISILDSRTLASQGKVFEDQNGDPIDTESMPDTMSLQPFTTRVTETDDDGNSKQVWKTRYLAISPNQTKVTVGNETYAVNPADISKAGAPTALGEHTVPTTRRTTDPATRQTTVSTTTPATSGIRTGGVPPPPVIPNAATPAAPAKRTGTGTGQKPSAKETSGTAPLDAEGHIPASEGSPQVVEGANQLLDGMDIKSLPAKTKELSGSLARKYGWEQGRFTPKEQVMLKESSTFLKEALDNPSMKVLDSTTSKLKLGQVLAAGGHQNMIGRTFSTLAASSMTPQEAEFVRMYNQLVGTVSGLSQLVRSGRATEAQIERLKAELPSVLTAKNAADGRKRIERLLKEIDVAMDKGRFGAAETKGGPPAPPAKMSEAARKYLESQGIKVP